MRVLYVYCHPLDDSFHAAIRKEALAGLAEAGHEVDLLDLYAEKFDPVLSEEGRRRYHDVSRNRAGLESYIARLTSAEALILQFPTWCFGLPAMLKGFFDRMIMPGVAFDLSDPAHVKPTLRNIKRIIGIVTYGRPRYMALWMSDPPRKIVKRYVRWFTGGKARADYYALYHLNVATDAQRALEIGAAPQHGFALREPAAETVDDILPARLIGVEKRAFELGPDALRTAADGRRSDKPGIGAPTGEQLPYVVARHQHVAVGEHDPVMPRRAPALDHIVELRIAAHPLVADQ